jgi:pyrroloquinoline quinone biosynthesis protein D
MNDATTPAFGKGVKLRRDADGSAMLLVPEGALMLNRVASAALELVDGKRTFAQIVEAIVAQFDVTQRRAHRDLSDLFDRLAERRFLRPFAPRGGTR